MQIPEKIKISKQNYDRLMAQNDKMVSVQTMMQAFQKNCEGRLQELNAETRRIWEDIRREHPDIDLDNVAWVPGKDGHITPVSMRLADGG